MGRPPRMKLPIVGSLGHVLKADTPVQLNHMCSLHHMDVFEQYHSVGGTSWWSG